MILYIVDTLRRDSLGCYGGNAQLTPNIDAFADVATVFEHALAQSPWTKASMASIFTGLVPRKHAAVDYYDVLAEGQVTLAELLSENGYQTVAFVANFNAGGEFGLDQGYEEFRLMNRATSHELNDAVADWLEGRRETERPAFVYVHTMDPHAPYEPPAEFGERFARGIDPQLDKAIMFNPRSRGRDRRQHVFDLRALYDAEVAFNDAGFGDFLALLEDAGEYDESLVVFSSDHGEEFLDHGSFRHGKHLYGEILGVPLIIRFPGQQSGVRVRSLAQHVDLLPTILDVAGLESSRVIQGVSLAGSPHNGRRSRPGFSEVTRGEFQSVAMVDGAWKIIRTVAAEGETPRYELYDLDRDPGEQEDLAEQHGSRRERMKGLLARVEVGLGEAAPGLEIENPAPEVSEELRALGYLE